jgi:hypothetical protein
MMCQLVESGITNTDRVEGFALDRREGNDKAALEKCNAVSGDAQLECKDVAAADYDAVKAKAKASEVSTKQ